MLKQVLGGTLVALCALGIATPGAAAVGPTTIRGDNFVLIASFPDACKVGADCTLTLRLEAQGAYHINDSYPYKFTPTIDTKDKKVDPPKCENVEFGKEQFSKANGDFKKDGEKTGTLTVTFKPTAPKGKIVGVYKMSVCSEQNCQLEVKPITLDVDAAK